MLDHGGGGKFNSAAGSTQTFTFLREETCAVTGAGEDGENLRESDTGVFFHTTKIMNLTLLTFQCLSGTFLRASDWSSVIRTILKLSSVSKLKVKETINLLSRH
ncbi:hypothetical protein Bbelb_172310 [Branchiostoma belcheri]|nr:hypothetical protein Bbelb_172310 [Branchiostoma belcheri]